MGWGIDLLFKKNHEPLTRKTNVQAFSAVRLKKGNLSKRQHHLVKQNAFITEHHLVASSCWSSLTWSIV